MRQASQSEVRRPRDGRRAEGKKKDEEPSNGIVVWEKREGPKSLSNFKKRIENRATRRPL